MGYSDLSETQKEELDSVSEANYNGDSGVCQWCGEDSKKLWKIDTVIASDLSHTVYRCHECGRLSWKYNWNGPTWRACARVKQSNGGWYYKGAGAP